MQKAKSNWRWLKWAIGTFAVLCIFIVAALIFRGPLLRGVARFWIVNEPLTHADVIVVLGGGPETRPFEAARLFHLGLAPKILLMNPRLMTSTRLGLLPAESDLCRNVLLKEKIPGEAIVVSPEVVTNSYDESLAVLHWAKANGATRVIIPTDFFHTRRVRWLYQKECDKAGIHTEIEAVAVHDYSPEDWWQHEEGIIGFQNEVLKYAYYRVKY